MQPSASTPALSCGGLIELTSICPGQQPWGEPLGESQGSTLRESSHLASPSHPPLAQLERQEGGVASLPVRPHVWTLVVAGRLE